MFTSTMQTEATVGDSINLNSLCYGFAGSRESGEEQYDLLYQSSIDYLLQGITGGVLDSEALYIKEEYELVYNDMDEAHVESNIHPFRIIQHSDTVINQEHPSENKRITQTMTDDLLWTIDDLEETYHAILTQQTAY